MRLPAVSRRTLLIGGGAGVGLVVAFLAWPRREGSPLRPGPREAVFGSFLRIATDGRVTLAVPQVEVGQGIWTGLAQIAADELGAAWETMAVEPAPHGAAYVNRLVAHDYQVETSGHRRVEFDPDIRTATARSRRSRAGDAVRGRRGALGRQAAECDTDGGFVIHEGKRLGFGEVSADAAGQRPPESPILRPASAGKLAGAAASAPRSARQVRRQPALRFRRSPAANDLRVGPNGAAGWPAHGLFASRGEAAAGPDRPGRAPGLDRRAGRNMVGGRPRLDPCRAAIHRRKSRRFGRPSVRPSRKRRGQSLFERGDYEATTKGSRPLSATYSIAATPHRSLEAPAAVARFTGDRLEVWAGTQLPDLARSAAAKAAGIGEGEVTFYAMPVGDGSGSAFDLEAIAIAVELAKLAGRPVSLALPPATAQNQDAVRSPMMARLGRSSRPRRHHRCLERAHRR